MGRPINTDFSNTDDFALAEEGVQNVRVEKVYEKVSKNGKEMVVFELKAMNGGRIFHNCMNYEGCRWMLKKTIHAITKVNPEKGAMSFDPDEFVGKEMRVNVFHDDFNGRVSAKIKDVLPPGSKASDPDFGSMEDDF